jgi:hypothetical protein
LGRVDRRRLERLESESEARNTTWEIPPHTRLLLKKINRHHARGVGEEPPAYTDAELLEMYREDVEVSQGRGIVGDLRENPGWQSEDGQTLLGAWEEDARRRLARAAELGDRWQEAYEDDETDEGEDVDYGR